jgi:hypothetical protein
LRIRNDSSRKSSALQATPPVPRLLAFQRHSAGYAYSVVARTQSPPTVFSFVHVGSAHRRNLFWHHAWLAESRICARRGTTHNNRDCHFVVRRRNFLRPLHGYILAQPSPPTSTVNLARLSTALPPSARCPDSPAPQRRSRVARGASPWSAIAWQRRPSGKRRGVHGLSRPNPAMPGPLRPCGCSKKYYAAP